MDGQVVTNPEPEYSRLGVRFYKTPIYNEKRSKGWMEEVPDLNTGEIKKVWHKGEGRDVFEEVDFIEIRIPGNVSEIRCRAVREDDKRKWPRAWEAYLRGQE